MQKGKMRQNAKGITLIALIITIIVMLILVGVSVTVALKGGLFSTAQEVTAKTEIERDRELALDEGRIKVNGVWYDSLQKYVDGIESDNQNDTEEGETVEKGTALTVTENAIQIGDLVYVGNPITGEARVYGNKGDIDYANEMSVMMGGVTISSEHINIASKVEINGNLYTVTSLATHMLLGPSATTDLTKLKTITIPNTVTNIGVMAFSGASSLIEITIPSTVTSIGNQAFYGTPWLTSQQENSTDRLVIVNNILIDGTTATGDIQIPNTVTSIGDIAFYSASSLTEITIPSSVTSIGFNAFNGCTALEKVTMQEGVRSIGDGMFSGCTSLIEITIPSTVTSIGVGAFNETPWFQEYKINATDGLVIVNNILIDGTTAKGDVNIPRSVTSIADNAFSQNSSLISVIIPNSVTSVAGNPFGFCSSLTEVMVYWTEGNKPEGWSDTWNTTNSFDGSCSFTIVYEYTE